MPSGIPQVAEDDSGFSRCKQRKQLNVALDFGWRSGLPLRSLAHFQYRL
jgi:uncharacterized protein YdeI (YjbR/CyaY-like superfamily)